MSTVPAPLGVVAHYNLLEQLEPAGPGELFRARDTHRGRTVAVRLLPEGFPADTAARRSLLESARSLIAMSHPNIITLYEIGQHEGRLFLAFEFLKGQSLRAEMAGRPMNVRRAVEVAVQIADAIADAHSHGYIHGGLSPESIVITAKGHAKVPAFELAAAGGFAEEAGEIRLHDYDSPEEARGQRADERSDVYSVGAVLYEMLTTRRPLHRGSAAPSAANKHVPPELDAVVLKAVAPNPDSRLQSSPALAAELRNVIALLDARGGAGDDDDPLEVRSTTFGRVVVTALVILVVLGAVIWWFA
jgi:serine/threonine-protein kinase